MQSKIIPINNFKDAFVRLGWTLSEADSGKYDIWTNPNNREIWTVVPKNIESKEYQFYQEKNIKMILYGLDLPETEFFISEIYNQLLGYNYKLINRIVNQDAFQEDSVPYELATMLPNKNIDAFRFFYYEKTQGATNLPIDRFEMNHTKHGSFIIPVSISAEVNDASTNTLFPTPTTTNVILRDYLNKIDTLTKIDEVDPKSFADKAMEEGIDSKIVKDFLYKADSIAKFREKYQDRIKDLSISSEGSPILDFKLKPQERTFKEVDLGRIRILPDEFISTLEKREIEADDSAISENHAKIEVSVELLSQDGTVKFSVYSINNEKLKKPFKGTTTELPKKYMDFCVDNFKDKDLIIITGDISKSKGKPAKIIPEKFEVKPSTMKLFEDEGKTSE